MCIEPDCKREIFEQERCRSHYLTARSKGVIPRARLKIVDHCEIEGCPGPGKRMRLCPKHYEQVRRHGHESDFEFDAEQKRIARKAMSHCSIADCRGAVHNELRGLCKKHYARFTYFPGQTEGGSVCPIFDCGRTMLPGASVCKRCRQFRWRYSLSDEQVADYFSVGRVCANDGCKSQTDLHMDHDHSCCPPGKFTQSSKVSCGLCIRGWLCASCNKSLGAMQESPERIRGLLEYLEKNQVN